MSKTPAQLRASIGALLVLTGLGGGTCYVDQAAMAEAQQKQYVQAARLGAELADERLQAGQYGEQIADERTAAGRRVLAVERKLVKECRRAVAIYFGLQGKRSCNALETSELAFMCLSCGWVPSII